MLFHRSLLSEGHLAPFIRAWNPLLVRVSHLSVKAERLDRGESEALRRTLGLGTGVSFALLASYMVFSVRKGLKDCPAFIALKTLDDTTEHKSVVFFVPEPTKL